MSNCKLPDDDKLALLVRQGMGRREIAATYGVNLWTVTERLTKAGLAAPLDTTPARQPQNLPRRTVGAVSLPLISLQLKHMEAHNVR